MSVCDLAAAKRKREATRCCSALCRCWSTEGAGPVLGDGIKLPFGRKSWRSRVRSPTVELPCPPPPPPFIRAHNRIGSLAPNGFHSHTGGRRTENQEAGLGRQQQH